MATNYRTPDHQHVVFKRLLKGLRTTVLTKLIKGDLVFPTSSIPYVLPGRFAVLAIAALVAA